MSDLMHEIQHDFDVAMVWLMAVIALGCILAFGALTLRMVWALHPEWLAWIFG